MYSALNCHNVAKYAEFYMGYLRFNVTSTGNAGCFEKSFTMVFQMLLCGECYDVSESHVVSLFWKPAWSMQGLHLKHYL
jgi:hypothetical protein